MKRLNLTGLRFGGLIVLSEVGLDKHKKVLWNCLCDCGNEKIIVGSVLKKNNTTNCGCKMKNDYEIRGEVTAIFLKSKRYGDRETIIDTVDLEKVKKNNLTWSLLWNDKTKSFYACGNIRRNDGKFVGIKLHRFLMDTGNGYCVDHINHDTLDNRCSINLRNVTNFENQQNKYKAHDNSKTGILGVTKVKNTKKYRAIIEINKKTKHLGYFTDIEKAKEAVKEAREKYMPYSQEATLKYGVIR